MERISYTFKYRQEFDAIRVKITATKTKYGYLIDHLLCNYILFLQRTSCQSHPTIEMLVSYMIRY